MSQDNGQRWLILFFDRWPPVDHEEIGMTNPGNDNLNQDIPITWKGIFKFDHFNVPGTFLHLHKSLHLIHSSILHEDSIASSHFFLLGSTILDLPLDHPAAADDIGNLLKTAV